MYPKIAVSAPIFSLYPFDDMLDRIEKEFSIWEIIAEGTCWLPLIKDRIKDILETSTIRFSVHAPLSDVNLASINPMMLETARKVIANCIEIAGDLGLSPVTVHLGHVAPLTMLNLERAKEIAQRSARLLEATAQEHNVTIAAENMPRGRWSMFSEPDDLLGVIEGTQWGLCLDIGHANISGNLDQWLGHSDRFVNVHIHDNNGGYDEHLVLGEGTIDLQGTVLRIKNGYTGNWVIECTELDKGIESRSILESYLRAH